MFEAGSNSPIKNTSYKVVIPFYAYAALSFLLATIFIMQNVVVFTQHYFHPNTLAITHTMALGWGTMIILGASHQLFPVIIEGKLHSNLLAYLTFFFAAIGIPLLIYSFYKFSMGIMAQTGGIFINLSVLCYIANLVISSSKSKKENIHAMFAITAAFWLFLTTSFGLLLVYNFTQHILSHDSIYYLTIHAHIGIIGWFLLMVMGVSSRLIPIFLVSKYENEKRLWWVYLLINIGLISFILIPSLPFKTSLRVLSINLIGIGILLFGMNIYKAYTKRIRKKLDTQIKISMLSVGFMIIPLLIIIMVTLTSSNSEKLIMLYGFTIFFGWITTLILGMTFKTLPFIIWNKVYNNIDSIIKTPDPKALFNNTLYTISSLSYLIGFVIFGYGIIRANVYVLNAGAALLLLTALMYNLNVFKIIIHQAK